MYNSPRAQGATEYLVLLAVVLIVALVSVALLGFFPGMASDSRITQSQAYWQSASPIAITEAHAMAFTGWGGGYTLPFIRVKNNGVYPIRITQMVAPNANYVSTIYVVSTCGANGTYANISDWYYLAPGEEKYFNPDRTSYIASWGCTRMVRFKTDSTSTFHELGGASSVCAVSNSTPGFLEYKSFGFDYIEYIDGQSITKRQVGQPLIIKCRQPEQ
jgi:hypothetical protein